jgi:hypothetical protein
MEAIPLSDTSTVACAKALIFTWISCFGDPDTITSDHGRNLLQTFGLNCVRCFTSPTNKQLLTILSRTQQSKDCTAASRTPLVHTPLRQLGPRSYLLCSSDSELSRGKTLVFPRLRQFWSLPLCCPMNFCKTKKCQLMPLSKFFKNLACFCCFYAQAQF